jgi:hypothetical protein
LGTAQVPWPDLVYALDEGFTAEEFRRVMDAPREALLRKRALIRRHLLDLSWHAPGSRVAGNILAETARYCLQPAASA